MSIVWPHRPDVQGAQVRDEPLYQAHVPRARLVPTPDPSFWCAVEIGELDHLFSEALSFSVLAFAYEGSDVGLSVSQRRFNSQPRLGVIGLMEGVADVDFDIWLPQTQGKPARFSGNYVSPHLGNWGREMPLVQEGTWPARRLRSGSRSYVTPTRAWPTALASSSVACERAMPRCVTSSSRRSTTPTKTTASGR